MLISACSYTPIPKQDWKNLYTSKTIHLDHLELYKEKKKQYCLPSLVEEAYN